MLRFTMVFLLLSPALSMAALHTAGWDHKAVNRECRKQLTAINYHAIETQFYEEQEAIHRGEGEECDEYWQLPRFSEFEEEAQETKEQKARREAVERQRQEEILQAERLILKKLRAIADQHPTLSSELHQQITQWKQALKNAKGRDQWPSDLAYSMGSLLRERKDYNGAISLYQLSSESPRRGGAEEDMAIGYTLLHYYNDTVDAERPRAPTSALFSAVRKSIAHLNSGSAAFEVGSVLATTMIQVRDMMVRWPISPLALQKDIYYPQNALLKLVYSNTFVEHLLSDLTKMDKVFSAHRYQGRETDADLLNALYNAGFYGFKKWCGKYPQYIWVSPAGYLVRIKYNGEKSSWEYTVGIALINPVEWNQDKAGKLLKQRDLLSQPRWSNLSGTTYWNELPTADDVLSFQYNEVFKIAIDGDYVCVMPAFRKRFYWYNPDATMDSYLTRAHRKLIAVGRKTHSGISFSDIDSFCSFPEALYR